MLRPLRSKGRRARRAGEGRRHAGAAYTPRAERLEGRALPATAFVTNLADSGGGSFRQAIVDANNHPGPDRIDFSLLPGSGVRVIQLLSPLPAVVDPVTVDGSTAPGYAGAPLVELRGELAGASAAGLVIAAGPTTVRGLAVNGFAGAGVVFQQGAGLELVASVVGLDAAGTTARPNGGPGVDVLPGVTSAVVGRSRDWRGLQDPPTTPVYATDANPHAVSAADLDGDGRPDLVTAHFGGTVTVALNDGAGGFHAGVSYPTAGATTDGVTLADLNGDGRVDVATANRDSNSVSVLLNLGAGVLAAPVTCAVGAAPHSVNAADLDGDGDADLVTVNRDSQDVTVLVNNGGGVFTVSGSYAVGGFPFESTVADFDRDGRPDLAVDNATSNTVTVLRNLGGAAFAAGVSYAVGAGPHSVTSGDFDGDGAPDLATADNFAGTVSVLLNRGDGTFAAATAVPVPGAIDIATADVNGDGHADLVTADSSGSTSVLLNDGAGGFAAVTRWDASGTPRAVVAADFNGDGAPDVAVAQFNEADVRVYRNLGASAGGNRIAANLGDGVRVNGGRVVVAANAVGSPGLGNGGNGVLIGPNALAARVGLAGAGNDVAANAGAGVAVTGATAGHAVRFNAFRGNALGIDLGADGPTANDPADADTGPNGLQNAPSLTLATPGPTTRVVGTFDGAASAAVTLDVYAGPSGPGAGQGERYLGTLVVTTDASGHAAFDTTLPGATAAGETVTATATAADGSTSEFAPAVAVAAANQAPTAALGGPALAVPGLPLRYTLAATDPDAGDAAAGFTYAVDFGDGSPAQTVARTPGNASGVALAHTFTRTGTFTVTLTATDRNGATGAAATLAVQVRTAALVPDPLSPGKTLLAVGGTAGDDVIKVKPGRECGEIKVVLRDDDHELIYRSTFDPVIDRIAVYALGGDDDVTVHPNVTTPAWVDGGEGDDRLKGGGGPSVLLGGPGADLLVGAAGRDLLIGGTGADRIVGDQGDDVLIAGATAFDRDEPALAAVLAEWTSGRTYAQRVANLRGDAAGATFAARANGNVFLAADGSFGRDVTVFDDGVVDVLTGDGGLDWFLFNADGDDHAKKDKATDLRAAEFADDLDFING